MKSIIAGLSLFALANAQNVYVATFGGDNNITGTVTVDNGYVIVDMVVGDSATVSSTENVTECTDGGLKYHIHKYWTHSNSTDRYVSGCGSTYTGGHWDPWHGCGSASGNDYCSNNGGCIPVSDYSADFTSDAFSAEVGDWNGKYGLAVVDDGLMSFTDSSYFEVTPDDMDLMNFSIVFHCNSGSRAFCAPFIEDTSTSATQSIPEQTNVTGYTSVGAYYDDIGSKIQFFTNGSVEMYWDPTYLYEETGCDNFSYGIFEAGNMSWDYSNGYMLTGDDCADYVGDFYDPTHQCMDFSGSDYCNATGLCGDANYSYSCDFASDRYSCAPGDLSGKMGSVSADSVTYATLDSTALIPRVSTLDGMMAVFYCGNNSEGISYGACAPIRNETEFTTTASPSNPTMEAVFYGDNGILGTVTVDNGYLMVDLDLSAEPNLPGGYSTCVSGGLKYHIHTRWDHDDYLDKINGTDCGAGYTGGHYDPWQGCGSASGNEYCSNNGGCIDVTDYSADYPDSVFSAEVGDWNGKYGLATVDSDGMIYFNESSFWEVTPDDIVNMSIVFHCNGGSRAFCAPFVATGTEASETIPDQDGSTVMADFSSADGYTDDSAVYLYANGSVDISLDGSEITDSTGCEEWYYGIFEAGSTDMNGGAFVGDDCESYVGDFYDPTHQCMDFSGSEYCNGTMLCGAYNATMYSSYEYTCDYDDDRYSCAPADLSGKFGAMTDYTVDLYESGPDTLIPSTDDMVGYVFAIYCGNNSVGISYLSCAEITTVTTTTTEDGDSAAAHTVVVSVVAMVMAMLF